MTHFDSARLGDEVAAALEDLKALDIRRYDLKGRSVFTDEVIVATGEAGRHVEAMADLLRVRSKALPRHALEGTGDSGWVLVDLGDVVVHLMTSDRRAFYGLDEVYAQIASSGRRA